MGKVCTSSCPYYGVDENYNGYCKKDHNSYRERFSPCNMEGDASASTPSAPPQHVEPRTCTSSCPYYGVDADYNGYCKKDHNSYRERFATCNMGEYTVSSGGGGSSSSDGGGCSKWVVWVIVALMLLGGAGTLLTRTHSAKEAGPMYDEPAVSTTSTTDTTATAAPQGDTMYVVAKDGLRMRSEPSTEGGILLTIPNESAVLVIRTEGDWSYVQYNGQEGWCFSEWIFHSIEEGTTTTTTTQSTTTTASSNEDALHIVSEGIREANRHIESYRGKTVSNANTKDTLTEDEVMSLFRTAYDLYMNYMWGNVTGGFEAIPGVTYENAFVYGSADGIWRQGAHSDYRDFDTLVRTYFGLFSDDLATYYLRDKIALINANMYYTTYPGKGDEGVKNDVSYAVVTVASGYNVIATANYYRDYEHPDQITDTKIIEFPLRKEDGAWVFTDMQWIPS